LNKSAGETVVEAMRENAAKPRELNRSLGLFDSTMIVAGSMIGSGIFIVAGEMAREVGSTGWLLLSWIIAGVLTLAAALSYGELAAMMPRAGGQYVYLREAYSPLWGFLYGWTLFLVIQTGTIAASSVGFSRYLGVLWRKSRRITTSSGPSTFCRAMRFHCLRLNWSRLLSSPS
jgi:amino acid transporter